MGHHIEVKEVRRTIHFDTGERLDLHNVHWFDTSGTHLRILAEEGLVILNPDRVLCHVVKPTARMDEAVDLQKQV